MCKIAFTFFKHFSGVTPQEPHFHQLSMIALYSSNVWFSSNATGKLILPRQLKKNFGIYWPSDTFELKPGVTRRGGSHKKSLRDFGLKYVRKQILTCS